MNTVAKVSPHVHFYRVTAVFLAMVTAASPQTPVVDPLAELKRLSRGTKQYLSASDAHNIADALVRPLSWDDATQRQIAQLLVNEQIAWHDGRSAGLNELKLAGALNRHLGLDSAPEYLQVRTFELRKIRVAVWSKLPDLSAGLDRKSATKGTTVVGLTLSPFEAYLASTLVVYQKLYNDNFLLTNAEQAKGLVIAPPKPGFSALNPNNRRTEFRNHLSALETKWSSATYRSQQLNQILEESRDVR